MSGQKIQRENYLHLLDQNKRTDRINLREQSKYTEQYFRFFCNSIPETKLNPTKNTDLIKMLKDRGILAKFDDYSAFNIRILSFSPNYEVLEIQLQWGYYKLKANVLNILGESFFHSHEFSKGANAKVYHIQEQSCRFSIKCIRNKNQQQQFTGEDKIKAFKEYFLNRVTSALECGPYMSNQCGFDILFNEQCVQFSMETCTNIELFRKQTIISLKNCLQVLHRMRIVHFDVKPQNVMWSNHFKREVYIDFGLSQVVISEPGFTYCTNFKGSPNFCSREMSVLLFSDQMGKVDIYYNDVFGLIETIKIFKLKTQFLENNLCDEEFSGSKIINRDNQIQYDVDPRKNILKHSKHNQNYLRKIIQLKYYIYTKNKDLIEAVYRQSEQDNKLIFSYDILNFVKNNCQAFYFQKFYQDYISESVKKSVQLGWIQKWVNSVFPKQQLSHLRQSPYFSFYNYLKIIAKKDNSDIDSFNRAELQQFLLFEKIADVQIYFQCFMKYISFINNIHAVNINQKEKYFQAFMKAMKINIEEISQQTLGNGEQTIIYKYLKQICKFILQYYINSNFTSTNPSFNNSKRIQLILDIFQHIFFFALLQTSQALQYLDRIYDMSTWSDVDKTHILLAIYTHNDWNFISLFSRRNIQFEVFERWIRDKIREFGKQNIESVCKQILDQLKKSQKLDDNLLLDEKQIKNIEIFRTFIWKNQLLSQLNAGKQYSLIKIKRLISQEIPYAQNRGLFSIYIHSLIIFDVCYENMEEYLYICQIFKRNILSEHFYNSFFFAKLSQIPKIKDFQEKIKLITNIVKNINFYNSGLIMVILCRQLERIQQYMKNIPLSKLLASTIFLELVQELQEATLRIDFRSSFTEQYHRNNNIREYKQYIYCYFSLKNQTDLLLRRTSLSISQDLVALSVLIESNPSKKSKTHMTLQLIRLKLQQIMMQNPQTAIQMLLKEFDAYLQFKNKCKCGDQIYFDFKIYSSVIRKLSILKCSDIRHLQIVRQFYQLSRANKMLEKYLQNRENPNILSLTLIAILQLDNLAELIYFIKQSFRYIRFTENIQTLCLAISEYKNFFRRQISKLNSEVIVAILANLQVYEKKLPYTAAFYCSYIEFSQVIEEKYNYLYKISQLLELMPQKMVSYFYVEMILLIVSGNIQLIYEYFIFSNLFGKRLKSQRIQRKKRVLKDKIVKLLCVHYQNHRSVQITEFKMKKNKNQKKKMLINKCGKVKAFKLICQQKSILLLEPASK